MPKYFDTIGEAGAAELGLMMDGMPIVYNTVVPAAPEPTASQAETAASLHTPGGEQATTHP
jgi:hypothetical protein